MKLSESIKPISFLKTYASEVIRDVFNNRSTVIITHNGEAKAVLQDIKTFEKTQESIALLKILSLGTKEFEKGKYKSLEKAFESTSRKINKFKNERREVSS